MGIEFSNSANVCSASASSSASGDCVRTPCSNLPPNAASLKLHHTREVDGMVMMRYHPRGGAPEFEPCISPLPQRDKRALYTVKEWITTQIRERVLRLRPSRKNKKNAFSRGVFIRVGR